MEATDATHVQNPGHKVRRPRAARACNFCRLKKNKCDELYPCTYCRNRKVECVYQGQDSRRRYTPEYVRSLEEKIERLSAQLGSQAAGSLSSASSGLSIPHNDYTNSSNPSSLKSPSGDSVVSSSGSTAHAWHGAAQEVTGVNRNTRNVEFYGSSSSVALLSHLQRGGERSPGSTDAGSMEQTESDTAAAALLSNLHNPAFSPPQPDVPSPGIETTVLTAAEAQVSAMEPTNFRQCSVFLHNFFSTLHCIHPIVDKPSFLERCEILWSGNEAAIKQQASFVPLYYSILSIGALVGYRDGEPIGGVSNQDWSRRFFNEARGRFSRLELVTDLEMIQCYFFMAKICQNELNAHWSYFYIGLAGRIALARGINRRPGPNEKKSAAQLKAEARTWWGIYSLEEELSFAMGRPSCLGADEYHNVDFPLTEFSKPCDPISPLLEPPHCAIIEHMVHFSRLTRQVCVKIYLPQNPVTRTVELADQLDRSLDTWLSRLPEGIRPELQSEQAPRLGNSKEAIWMKRQKLVLNIRYLNLRTLLFGSILLTSTPPERSMVPGSSEGTKKCLDSARQTIELIYETYAHQEFFRTWFYNTTYTIIAASIILVYTDQEASEAEIQPLLKLVSMAIEVLETMADECVVAGKSAKLLQKAMVTTTALRHEKTSKTLAATLMPMTGTTAAASTASGSFSGGCAEASGAAPDPMSGAEWRHCWASGSLVDNEMLSFDFGMTFMDFEGNDWLPAVE